MSIKISINFKRILIFSLIIFLFSAVDMVSTYKFVNILGIEAEGNSDIIEIYDSIGNFAFPFWSFFLFLESAFIFAGMEVFSEYGLRKYKNKEKIKNILFVVVSSYPSYYLINAIVKNFGIM